MAPSQRPPAPELVQLVAAVVAAARYVRDAVWIKLAACLLVDLFGLASYLLPGVGELADLGWAPIQAYFLLFMFQSARISALGFIEEIVPGLDFLPTATIAWACENLPSDAGWLMRARRISGCCPTVHPLPALAPSIRGARLNYSAAPFCGAHLAE
eukprot:scaffold103154_cov32-Tisochrysis_lutea.AAC.1